MGLYEKIRERVTAREAAEAYGVKVNRSGMACCPFHNDRIPSLKLDHRFHCFGCGADGDVIDFTAKYFAISPYDAAKRLAKEFGIEEDGGQQIRQRYDAGDRGEWRQKRDQSLLRRRFEKGAKRFYRIMTDYYHLLGDWQEKYAPGNPEEEWDPRFCEALQKRTILAYVLDCFLEGTLEEQVDIMNEYKEEVLAYDRVLTGLAKRENRSIKRDARSA